MSTCLKHVVQPSSDDSFVALGELPKKHRRRKVSDSNIVSDESQVVPDTSINDSVSTETSFNQDAPGLIDHMYYVCKPEYMDAPLSIATDILALSSISDFYDELPNSQVESNLIMNETVDINEQFTNVDNEVEVHTAEMSVDSDYKFDLSPDILTVAMIWLTYYFPWTTTQLIFLMCHVISWTSS